MKKIIILALTVFTIFGCKKIPMDSLRVRTNAEYVVADKTKNIEDFHYKYLVNKVGGDVLYNYIDTIDFNVGDTLVVIIKRK